jgi:phosphatidate phosphatase APP1
VPAATVELAKLGTTIKEAVTDADTARAASLARFSRVQEARSYMLARERADLPESVPAADKAAVESALATAKDLAHSLSVEAAVAKSPPPVPAEDETVVHGVVTGVTAGTKVTLTDAKGHKVTTTTDKDGRFIVHKAKKEVAGKLELRVDDARHTKPVELEANEPLNFIVLRLRS